MVCCPSFFSFWCAKLHSTTYAPQVFVTPDPPLFLHNAKVNAEGVRIMLQNIKEAFQCKTSLALASYFYPLLTLTLSPSACPTFTFLGLHKFAYALDCILFFVLNLCCSIWVMHAVLLVSTPHHSIFCVSCATLPFTHLPANSPLLPPVLVHDKAKAQNTNSSKQNNTMHIY